MAKNPSKNSVKFRQLREDYGAQFFPEALSRYVAEARNPDPALTWNQREAAANNVQLFFSSIPVFHRIKFSTPDPYGKDGAEHGIVDSIHVETHRTLNNGDVVLARFDTALINTGWQDTELAKFGLSSPFLAELQIHFSHTISKFLGIWHILNGFRPLVLDQRLIISCTRSGVATCRGQDGKHRATSEHLSQHSSTSQVRSCCIYRLEVK
ncbi:hypothetical protein B0H14DRAFT_2612837 [Mycena olivaceomarginata]|nr:hypothetical protein B0H14DRAFT_2612837 [Mycena olivaceomarginata]